VKERFQEAGIRPGGWGLPVDFHGTDNEYQAGLAKLPEYAALAQELGSSWCTTWILPFSDTLDYTANMAFHVQRLQPIASILADHGCRFGLEFVGPQTLRAGHAYPFIHTIAEALELGERLHTGNMGLLLDSFHWYTSHASAEELRQLRTEQIVYVHVNDGIANRSADTQLDGERALPGASGVIDIKDFLQALQALHYEGPVVVEPFSAELKDLPPAERVRLTAASLTKVFRQAGIRP
jgi:sugar phosphate isomerase/epimerase